MQNKGSLLSEPIAERIIAQLGLQTERTEYTSRSDDKVRGFKLVYKLILRLVRENMHKCAGF